MNSFLGNFYRHLAIFFWSHCPALVSVHEGTYIKYNWLIIKKLFSLLMRPKHSQPPSTTKSSPWPITWCLSQLVSSIMWFYFAERTKGTFQHGQEYIYCKQSNLKFITSIVIMAWNQPIYGTDKKSNPGSHSCELSTLTTGSPTRICKLPNLWSHFALSIVPNPVVTLLWNVFMTFTRYEWQIFRWKLIEHIKKCPRRVLLCLTTQSVLA